MSIDTDRLFAQGRLSELRRQALHGHLVTPCRSKLYGLDTMAMACGYCHTYWEQGEPEHHNLYCIVSPASAELVTKLESDESLPVAAGWQARDAEIEAADKLLAAFVTHRTATHELGRTKLGQAPCLTCDESSAAIAAYRAARTIPAPVEQMGAE